MKTLVINYFTQLNYADYTFAFAAMKQKNAGMRPRFFPMGITGYLTEVATAFFASLLAAVGTVAAGTAAVFSVARAWAIC